MKIQVLDQIIPEDLTQIKECKDIELDLSHSLLSTSMIAKIFNALTLNKNIIKLTLNSVKLVDSPAVNQFIREMQANKTISILDICDTPQLTEETRDLQFPMTDILTKNRSIRSLSIGNEINPLMHALVLRLFANKHLASLHIKYLSLTIEGMRGVSHYLQGNVSLSHLELRHFTINNQAGEGEFCTALFKKGIAENRSLQSIRLEEIKFSQDNNDKLLNSILEEAKKKDSSIKLKNPPSFSSPTLWKSTCVIPKIATPRPLRPSTALI